MPEEEETEEDEESELEEELEEELELEPDTERLTSLLQTQIRHASPVLEQVEVDRGSSFSLEQGVGLESSTSREENSAPYESIKDPSQDYEDPSKKQQGSSGDMRPISVSSHIDMESMGRTPERIGREFHMNSSESNMPESAKNYEIVSPGNSENFQGKKTALQKEMDRRYEVIK